MCLDWNEVVDLLHGTPATSIVEQKLVPLVEPTVGCHMSLATSAIGQ